MRKGKTNREQAVAEFGETLINKLDGINCEMSGRLQTDGDESVEFFASVRTDDGDCITAYYYLSQDEIDANADDLGGCNWEINGYEVT